MTKLSVSGIHSNVIITKDQAIRALASAREIYQVIHQRMTKE